MSKRDISRWLSGAAGQLGDNKFQYVDRFIKKLDQTSLPAHLRTQVRSLNQSQTSFALSRQFGEGTYSDEAVSLLSQRFDGSVFGNVLFELISDPHKPIKLSELEYRATLWLIFTHSVQGACAAVDVLVTSLGRPPFLGDLDPDQVLATDDLSPADFTHLYSGSLLVVSPEEHFPLFEIEGFLLLKQQSHLVPPSSSRHSFLLPNISATTFRNTPHIEVQPGQLWSKSRLSTPFPIMYDCSHDGIPRVRTWRRRHYQSNFITDIQFENHPLLQIASHHSIDWNPVSRSPQVDDLGAKFAIGWTGM